MSELLTVVCSGFLCKTHIFNFKTAVSQPIRGFHFLANFQKNQKNTKIQQNSKNVKIDLPSFVYRYALISTRMRRRICDLWTLVGSEFLCKTHIFNFKSLVSQPIMVFQYFGNLQKNQKNTKNSANFQKCQKRFAELYLSL